LTALQLSIQEATVKATMKLLQSKIPKTTSKKDVVIASLDGKIENDCAAILVAAALDPKFNLDDKEPAKEEVLESESRGVTVFIGENELSLTTISEVISLLDRQIQAKRTSGVAGNQPATTKDVQNFIERHLGSNSHLLLFNSTDIKIEQRVLTDLQTQGNTIHCHMNDDFQYRMQREKAKVGDITITLAWDNRCDLDLHCICPNGDHISYSRKEGGGAIGGGYLDVDMNVSGDSTEPVENIFFGDAEKGVEAAKGKYKVFVQNYAYHGKIVKRPNPVPWRLRVVKNGEIHNFTGECKGTGEDSNVTAVEFEYEGRKAPPPEEVGSALASSNLVSVTSSTGDTIDSISGLLSVVEEHEQLTNVQNLVRTETEQMEMEEEAVDGESDIPIEESNTNSSTSNNVSAARPLMAAKKSFDITNRDRLYLNLSKLPKLFHLVVNQSFDGGCSLMDHTAAVLAKRLISDGIPVNELMKAGYQDEIVQIVKEKMCSFGL